MMQENIFLHHAYIIYHEIILGYNPVIGAVVDGLHAAMDAGSFTLRATGNSRCARSSRSGSVKCGFA